jgi:protein TonB
MMMMIRTAGGPSMVSPLDYGERRERRVKTSTWVAIGVVSAAHIGLGAALYAQRFELETPPPSAPGPVTIIDLFTPPPPPKALAKVPPQPPTTRTNPLPAPPTTRDVITVASGETVADSTTLTTTTVVPEPTPDAIPTPEVIASPPRLITNPSWQRKPSGDQLARAYPDRALAAGVSGSAMLNCRVEVSGRVSGCAVTSETPGGQGFGRAAQGLSRYFQLNPRMVNGAAEGSRVNIGLRFAPPAD